MGRERSRGWVRMRYREQRGLQMGNSAVAERVTTDGDRSGVQQRDDAGKLESKNENRAKAQLHCVNAGKLAMHARTRTRTNIKVEINENR